MMVPAPRTPGTGNTGSAFVPDAFPSLANSDRRLVFFSFDKVLYDIDPSTTASTASPPPPGKYFYLAAYQVKTWVLVHL